MAELEVTDLEADDTTFDGHGAPPASDAPSPQGDIQQLPPAAARDERQRQPSRRPSKGQMGEPPLRGPSPTHKHSPDDGRESRPGSSASSFRGARERLGSYKASRKPSITSARKEVSLECSEGSAQMVLKGEDAYSSWSGTVGGESVHLVLVADGHGGDEIALQCRQSVLPSIVEAAGSDPSDASWRRACKEAFRQAHAAACASGVTSGSTLTVCCVNLSRREVTCANVGDSSAYLVPYELLEAPPAKHASSSRSRGISWSNSSGTSSATSSAPAASSGATPTTPTKPAVGARHPSAVPADDGDGDDRVGGLPVTTPRQQNRSHHGGRSGGGGRSILDDPAAASAPASPYVAAAPSPPKPAVAQSVHAGSAWREESAGAAAAVGGASPLRGELSCGEAELISEDHRLETSGAERERVKGLGGTLAQAAGANGYPEGPIRVWPGGLAVARTIGDVAAAGLVSADPTVRTVALPPYGASMIVASDGVWDSLAVEVVSKLIRRGLTRRPRAVKPQLVAEQIVAKAARARGALWDDTSCVVVHVSPPAHLLPALPPARSTLSVHNAGIFLRIGHRLLGRPRHAAARGARRQGRRRRQQRTRLPRQPCRALPLRRHGGLALALLARAPPARPEPAEQPRGEP